MSTNEANKALAAAMAHHQAGRLAEAEPLYRAVVDREPRNADALHFLGVLLHHTNRLTEAQELMRRSLELNPSAPHFHANFAELSRALGDPHSALHHARAAVRLNPQDADCHHSLGMALRKTGDAAGAIAAFEAALRVKSGHRPAMNQLGATLSMVGRVDESIAILRRLIALGSPRGESLNALGSALQLAGNLDEAIECFGKALQLNPSDADSVSNLGNAQLESGHVERAIESFERAVQMAPHLHQAGSNRLMALNYRDGFTPADEAGLPAGQAAAGRLFEAHVDWARKFAPNAAPPAHSNERDPARRLRIGYVSADFRFHSVALFFEPLLEAHDPQAVEVFCYSNVAAEDAMTRRFQSLAHHWRAISAIPDLRVAEMIRDDRIDILIDLSGHTDRNRLLLFALKPAPVQVSYLGWQNTTGLRAMDARLTDEHVDPPGLTDPYHTEALVRLPGAFAVYKPRPEAPFVGPLPARANGFVTFGSFSKIAKITPAALALWAATMNAVPQSRLLMVATGLHTPSLRSRIIAALEAAGVSRDRIELSGDVTFKDYMALHGRVDIILDTFPFNGHTTTCHGLWMGVPTLTLAGDRYASRMGLSVMTHMGLADQLVAQSGDEFIRKGAALAADLPGLESLRGGLRQRMSASPLMDGKTLARNVESAYRRLWQAWCEGGKIAGSAQP